MYAWVVVEDGCVGVVDQEDRVESDELIGRNGAKRA